MTGANGQYRHDTCRNGEKENKRDVRIAWFRGRNHLYYRRSRRFHWAANKGIHFARIICTRTPPSSVGLTTPFRTQPFQSPTIFTILSNGTKILKAVKVSQKKQTPYILPFVCWQAVLIGFPETQQQFWPKVQRSNPSPLTLWLASTFVTCCTRFVLHHSHKISYLYCFRVLEKHTLAKGVTLDFKQIRRGINSRTISRHGVEYIKDLIIKTGQQIIV